LVNVEGKGRGLRTSEGSTEGEEQHVSFVNLLASKEMGEKKESDQRRNGKCFKEKGFWLKPLFQIDGKRKNLYRASEPGRE